MNRQQSPWTRFWLPAGEARELALFRTLFYLACLPYLWIHFRQHLWDFPETFHTPLWIHTLLPIPPLSADFAFPAYGALAALALACACGLGGPAARALFLLGGLYVFGNRYAFGVRLGQVDSPLLICSFLLIFARCDDALRIGRKPAPAEDWEYGWPVQFCRVFLVLVIWEAGLAKLRAGGTEWFRLDGLHSYLTLRFPPGSPAQPPPLAHWLLAHPELTRPASLAALLLELTFPLTLLRGRIGAFYITSLALFLGTVRALLGHPFLFSLLPLFAAYLPIRRWCRILKG